MKRDVVNRDVIRRDVIQRDVIKRDLQRALPVLPHHVTPVHVTQYHVTLLEKVVRVVRFELTTSCAQGTRATQLRHTLISGTDFTARLLPARRFA